MKGRFLLDSKKVSVESNIYADKSALILDWLLRMGIDKEGFSIREAAKEIGISLGLVHKVFETLILKGWLQTKGVRTAKSFFLKKPELLLKSWLEQYIIVKKCKMWTYRSGFQGRAELLEELKKSNLGQKVSLALHSAADAYGCKNTNLNSLELYILKPTVRIKIEKLFQLEPQERGYEVLLIEPYYKSLLNLRMDFCENMQICPAILAFLDLYHFPLRGQEQAEFMAQRIPELKRIYKTG